MFPLRPSPTSVGLKLSATHAAIRHVCDLTSCYMLLRPCINSDQSTVTTPISSLTHGSKAKARAGRHLPCRSTTMMQQLRHSQPSPCLCGLRAARPMLALGAAASRSRPAGKLQPSACLGLGHVAPAAARGQPRPRAVADSALGASPTSVHVGGKLLLQNFAADSQQRLKLSIQLVSATVAGTRANSAIRICTHARHATTRSAPRAHCA